MVYICLGVFIFNPSLRSVRTFYILITSSIKDGNDFFSFFILFEDKHYVLVYVKYNMVECSVFFPQVCTVETRAAHPLSFFDTNNRVEGRHSELYLIKSPLISFLVCAVPGRDDENIFFISFINSSLLLSLSLHLHWIVCLFNLTSSSPYFGLGAPCWPVLPVACYAACNIPGGHCLRYYSSLTLTSSKTKSTASTSMKY